MAQPRFEFRLEALLTQRLTVEKEKQRRVGAIQQEMQALIHELKELQLRISTENRALTATHLTGRLDMHYIAHEKRFVGNLHVKIILGMQKLAGIEQTLAGARAELLAAARARKVIEKLREKQFARWRLEQERKESAALDEIGTQLALRQALEAEFAAAHGELS